MCMAVWLQVKVRGCGLGLWPIGLFCLEPHANGVNVTRYRIDALMQLQYVACGTIQVLSMHLPLPN